MSIKCRHLDAAKYFCANKKGQLPHFIIAILSDANIHGAHEIVDAEPKLT